MLQSEHFGKLIISTPASNIGALLHLIASKYKAEIKEITNLPEDMKITKTRLVDIESDDNPDFSMRDFKFRMMEKKIAEAEEHLRYILKTLGISPKGRVKHRFEFHVRDLDDLITKILKKTGEMYATVQDNFNNRVVNSRAIAKTWEEMAVLESLTFFDFKKDFLKELSFININMVRVSNKNYGLFKSFLDSEQIYYYETKITETHHFFIIASPKSMENLIEEKKKLYNAREFIFLDEYFQPDGSLDIEGMHQKMERLNLERSELADELDALRRDFHERIVAINELFENSKRFLRYHNQMHFIQDHVVAEFWLRVNDWPLLKSDFEKQFTHSITYEFLPLSNIVDDTGTETREDEEIKAEEPPTLMKIPKLMRPYTTVLNLYGLPRYNELNPLIFIFFSFPLLFGLMFGDVGQGIALVIAGLVFAKIFSDKQGWHNFSLIVFWCGLGAIFGGFLYGEFFGFEFEIFIGATKLFPIFRPFEGNVLDLFKFTIWVGTFQITMGLILRGYNYAIQKRKLYILTEIFPKCGLLWGVWLSIQQFGFDVKYFMSVDFLGSFPGLFIISCLMLLIFGTLIGKAMKLKYLRKKSALGLVGENTMETFETVLSFLSNAISYARIFAMTMVHLGFMLAVRLIAEQFGKIAGTPIVFGILYAIGNIFVVIIELLLVIIQNVRLHFYEFFSKFYTGGGKQFEPLKYDVRFSKLYFDNNEIFIIQQK